uniref:ATP synthase complex subunit 8 n=1 Tax=Belzebub intermedius TaxID=2306298 RepID=A0A346RNH5_9EUCA|nr:ATP synthase F0 subunit 8 [Belzebub intermedius]AXS67622.1 ATP synthase F0 subunit 8 [Belzebub intermedius]
MPQMAPMMWLNLFLIFSITFMIFLVVNYFTKAPKKANLSSKTLNNISLNWKW